MIWIERKGLERRRILWETYSLQALPSSTSDCHYQRDDRDEASSTYITGHAKNNPHFIEFYKSLQLCILLPDNPNSIRQKFT